MPHAQTARKSNSRSAIRDKPGNAQNPVETSAPADSKKTTILALLNRSEGATIAAMQKATGWQPHSVRGFLSGQVHKKLGLALHSEAAEARRVYRVVAHGGTRRGSRRLPNARAARRQSANDSP
jgi:hypothetical protein